MEKGTLQLIAFSHQKSIPCNTRRTRDERSNEIWFLTGSASSSSSSPPELKPSNILNRFSSLRPSRHTHTQQLKDLSLILEQRLNKSSSRCNEKGKVSIKILIWFDWAIQEFLWRAGVGKDGNRHVISFFSGSQYPRFFYRHEKNLLSTTWILLLCEGASCFQSPDRASLKSSCTHEACNSLLTITGERVLSPHSNAFKSFVRGA